MKTFFLFLALFQISYAAQITWSDVINLYDNTVPNGLNSVAINNENFGLGMWEDPIGRAVDISAATFDQLNWSAPTVRFASGENPIVVVDDQNRGLAIFKNFGSVDWTSYNGSWTSPQSLDRPTALSDYDLVMQQSTGKAIAVLSSADGINAYHYDGNSWTGPVLIAMSDGDVDLAINQATGEAVLVWTDLSQVIHASFYNGVTWSAPQDLTTSMILADQPQVAMNRIGEAVATWVVNSNYVQAIRYDGTSWGMAETISDPSENALSPQVVLDDQGKAFIVWRTDLGGTGDALKVKVSNGLSWQDSTTLALNEDAENTRIAMNPFDGTAVIVWSGIVNGKAVIRSSFYNQTNWEPMVTLSNEADAGLDHSRLSIAVGSQVFSSTYLVLWEEGFSIRSVYGLETSEPTPPIPTPPLPPENLKATQTYNRFPTQAIFGTILTWQPSASTNIAKYLIYRNDVLIGEVGASGPYQFTDPLRKPNVKYTYKVVAVNLDGLQSSPAIVVVP